MWNDDSDDIHKQGDADVRQRCAPATSDETADHLLFQPVR